MTMPANAGVHCVARINAWEAVPPSDCELSHDSIDASFIAACSPANIAAILAHVDAQAAEIERLRAERDSIAIENSKFMDQIECLRAERDEHAHWRRDLADKLHDRETDIIELRRQFAEAELDAQRYRWLRNEASTARKCDPMVCIYPLDEQDLIDGDRLDVAIDAAMDLTRPAEEA